jgi:hypothetical protein
MLLLAALPASCALATAAAAVSLACMRVRGAKARAHVFFVIWLVV